MTRVKPAVYYAANMKRLRDRGWTYTAIGRKYGVTRQRAQQIVKGSA